MIFIRTQNDPIVHSVMGHMPAERITNSIRIISQPRL